MLGVSGTDTRKGPAVRGGEQADRHTIRAKCHHLIHRRTHLEAEGMSICQEKEARKANEDRSGAQGLVSARR